MKIKKNLLFLFCMMFVLAGGLTARPKTAAAKEVTTPIISNIRSATYKALEIEIKNMDQEKYECEIYRSTSKDGVYKKKGTIVKYGTLWCNFGGYTCVFDSKGRILYGTDGKTFTYTDYTAAYNQEYYYKIKYIEYETGDESAYSNIVSCRTVLSEPDFLKITGQNYNKIHMEWSKIEGADGYILYRKDGGKWKKYKIFSKKTFQYTDTAVKKGVTYSYRIRAYRKSDGKTTYSPYGKIGKISLAPAKVSGDYKSGSVYGPSLSTSQLDEVRQVVQSFKTNFIKSGMSDYQKVKTAHDYLCINCGYASSWQYNGANTAWGALVYGEAQCSGYARAMKALCDAIGIPCYYVHANAKAANPSHQWNQVKVDGKWYIVDVQANALSGFYAFFLVSGDYYKSSAGMRWDTAGLPATSKKNYVAK